MRDFGGLLVVQLRDQPRVGHQPRVGGEDPGHVLPQRHDLGAQRAREQRGGEVGAAAAERGDAAVGGPADEARHDRHPAGGQVRPQHLASGQARRRAKLRTGAAVVAVGDHDLGRVDVDGPAAGAGDGGGQQRGRQAFARGRR